MQSCATMQVCLYCVCSWPGQGLAPVAAVPLLAYPKKCLPAEHVTLYELCAVNARTHGKNLSMQPSVLHCKSLVKCLPANCVYVCGQVTALTTAGPTKALHQPHQACVPWQQQQQQQWTAMPQRQHRGHQSTISFG
jgi:hypothetical protein